MNKVIFALIISVFTITLLISPVVAKNDSEASDNAKHRLEELREKREGIKLRIQEKREAIQDKKAERMAKVEEKLEASKQRIAEKIKKLLATMVRRLSAALVRLDGIAERIASRIDKLDDKGVDTSGAQQALADAEILGAEAAEAVGGAAAAIEGIDTADKSAREIISEARGVIRETKGVLKAYHKGLVAAIVELKASSKLREGTGGGRLR